MKKKAISRRDFIRFGALGLAGACTTLGAAEALAGRMGGGGMGGGGMGGGTSIIDPPVGPSPTPPYWETRAAYRAW